MSDSGRSERTSTTVEYFDGYFEGRDDPWRLDTSWYERRKRDILLASLPAPRVGRALEIGCAYGAITLRLRERAEHVLAVDLSEIALAHAAERIGDDPRVTLRRALLPAEWPEGRFDLVVLSEVAYYWSASDLAAAVERMMDSLDDDAVLIACHYRPENPHTEAPITGEYVHEAIRARPELDRIVEHVEPQFRIEVFRRRPRPA